MKQPQRRSASPPSKGAALAVRPSRPGGAFGLDSNTHTLVLDIGKSNAKLVLFNAEGDVLTRRVQANAPVDADGYTALGTEALQTWLLDAMPMLPERRQIGHIGITTHGAAFCALGDEGLALPPMDYEWDGYGPWRERYVALLDGFDVTGSPLLPLGLNAGLQLYWLQQNRPGAWARLRHWLPYPQYWAWWFTGEVANEATSLGCHTHLWQPARNAFAPWAVRQGLTGRFPTLRAAHEVLGRLRPELATALGLPASCRVHVGLHDSNACLARHLHALPGASVVSTGTWTVIMAPGVPTDALTLDPLRDQLFNQSVEGQPVPTARFMGGREFAHLCHGADPSLATLRALRDVIDAGWMVLPEDSARPGAAHGRVAELRQGERRIGNRPGEVPLHLRPALGAWYCALMTAQTHRELLPEAQSAGSAHTVVLEGPMADNPAYVTALAALLSPMRLLRSVDEVEGTARGAWLSTRWDQPGGEGARYADVARPEAEDMARLQAARAAWAATLEDVVV